MKNGFALELKELIEENLERKIICECELASSHFRLAESFYELTHPLRSISITETSTLLQDDPPPSWSSLIGFSLNIT